MVNRSLGNILRSLINESSKKWDQVLSQDELSYNDSPNQTIGMSSFQILYRIHPRGVYELRNLGKQEGRSVDGEYFATNMQELQERVKHKLQERNNK